MIKQKLFLTIALLLGTLAPHSVLGYDFYATAPTGQRLYYTITDSSTHTVSVVPQNSSSPYYSSVSPSGVLEIPASVTYNGTSYSVTSIGYAAFYDCSGLTGTLTIPNSVTSIEAWGFGNCSGLTSVTIGNSVTSLNLGTFQGCTGLTSVTLGNSVTSIGQQAFYGCIGLTSITIPNSVTSIEAWGFGNCSGLTSATIGNSVTSIGKYAFTRCTGLTGSLTIPNSVTTIGRNAFDSCINLQNIVLSNNLSRIDTALFQHCTGLTSVTIPNSVTSIGYYAFAGCTGLTSVTIPNSVTSIGSAAFFYCTGLSSVTIGNSVTSIEEYAFQNCTGLTSVTIPNSVTSIGYGAFSVCTGLTSVTIPNSVISIGFNAFQLVNNVVYNGSLSGCPWGGKTCNGYIEDSLIYSDATKTTLTGFVSGLSVAIIPNSVTSIGGWAFVGCTGLTSLNYNAVNCSGAGFSYDYNWLANCNALTTVNIGNSVERIPACAFYGCTGLTNVTIPNSVTSIGQFAFYDCTGLTSVTIPNSVTSIGNYAFNSVNNVIYNGNLSGCPWGGKNCNGYIEDSLIYSDATKTTLTGFVSGLSVAIIPNSVTSIGNSAFYGCTSLTSVTIPNSVTSIGNSAFYYCTGLTSVTIPNSVTSIGGYAFRNCTGLTTLNYYARVCSGDAFRYISEAGYVRQHWLSGCTALTTVNIGNSVAIIPSYAFYYCTGLSNVTIGNSVTSIGGNAFYGCSGLTSVTIPNSVTSIGNSAFSGCTGLTSVTIGNSVTNINDSLFYGCTGLTSVTIPNSVTRIGNYAFRGCSGLTSVTIGNSVTSIGKLAFSGCIGLATMNYNAVNCGGDGFTPDYYNNYNGWLFGSTALTSVNIGNSVARIPNYAFYNCTSLNSVTIPNSVTSIGEAAFLNCTNLNTINYNATNCSGDGFTTSSWLRGCSSLTRVNVGNNVRSIPENAFSNCTGLRVLDLGSGLTSVGANAFYNCDHLDSIYSRSTTPPTVANTNAFENVWKGLPLTVPTGSRSAYAVAYAWRDFTNIVEMSAAQFTVTVNVNDASMGTVSGGGSYALGATVTLTATPNTGYHFVQWNDGNTQNPRTVTVTGNATYMAYFAADQSNAPQIAYVGVDSNGHNAVSWTPQAGTSPVRYNVYREGIQAGVYELVGVVNASGAASYSWTDDQSNPATRAYSYRLAEVAADNTESDLSIPHTTIHLQINQGQGGAWNLTWTPYAGFAYSTYRIYRGATAASLSLLTTLPATATTYSDLNTGGTAYYYQIEVVQLGGAKTTAVSSRSNIVTTDPDPQTYTLTVLSADVQRGTVTGGGSYTEGTMATLTAEANEGYVFLQWQDGSTANPRNILVTANGTYMAYFTQTEGIADAEGSNVTITARNGRIQVSGAEGRQVMLSDALGRILYRGTAMEPLTVEAPATGIYLLQVDGHPAHRISVVR